MSDQLLIESDNIVTWTGLKDAETGSYINDATVAMSLFSQTTISPNAAKVAVDKGGGKVGIPSDAHGLVSGDYIRIISTKNYNGEYTVDAATTTNEIVITATYVAETFLGTEEIYVGITNGTNLSLSYVAGSDGIYKGNLPDTLKGIHEYESSAVTFGGTTTTTGCYVLFATAVKDTAKKTKKKLLQAVFDS